MLTDCENIQRARSYSEATVDALRGALAQLTWPNGTTVIAVGSLARREASEQSDLDYFVVCDNCDGDAIREQVRAAVAALHFKAPSPTGAFAKVVSSHDFVDAIGGSDESNEELTRRMLFLLESDWLYGEQAYHDLFDGVIERYIMEGITQHQLARFFLNDLIRYYRTICVDFQYKTETGGKSWGDRNIKLMFSRKLLYFSGVLAAAETAQSVCHFKRRELGRLLRLSPVARVVDVCGYDCVRVVHRYDEFLGWMCDPDMRALLRKTTADRSEHTDEFREMKNAGHHFSWELESLLHRRYAPTHPIYQAVLL